MTRKHIIGGVVIVVFAIWGMTVSFQTTTAYVSLEEAARSKRVVQVIGKIDFDALVYNVEESRLEFAIYDMEAADEINARRLPVRYYGIVPGNFDQSTSVVLKGKPGDDGVFVADQMLVKCPSKYQGETDTDYQDMNEHNEAVGNSGV